MLNMVELEVGVVVKVNIPLSLVGDTVMPEAAVDETLKSKVYPVVGPFASRA